MAVLMKNTFSLSLLKDKKNGASSSTIRFLG